MIFQLDSSHINDIQVQSLLTQIQMAKHAHYTDLVFRINGKNQHQQADWLKYLQPMPDTGTDSTTGTAE